MAQITLYLDEDTTRLMREQARAAGLPYSRWVAQLIRAQSATDWPPDVLASFGAFPDAPLPDELRTTDVPDRSRIDW
jgi:hypothetical protein